MKTKWRRCLVLAALLTSFLITVPAQEAEVKEKFTTGLDIYSGYFFRGTRYGQGPSFQPSVKFVDGGFSAGVWGAFDANGYMETDPYLSYTFPFGLSLGLTDYYFPALRLFEVSESAGSHSLEINAGYTIQGFSLSANFIINEAGGTGSAGGDLYFQAGYTFSGFNIFAGAGNGWHTSDGEFNLCNIGFSAVRQITLSDKFSFPLIGMIIMNPEREQLSVVAGFCF